MGGEVFWSSDKLTGSQTVGVDFLVTVEFWSSDKLTGSQTTEIDENAKAKFWSSDKLTGSQTQSNHSLRIPSFGAVTN